jgi:hypothetical protein
MFLRTLVPASLALALSLGLTQNAFSNIPKVDPTVKVTVGGFFKFIGAAVHNHHENKDKDIITHLNANNIKFGETPFKRRHGDFLMDAEVIVKADGTTQDGLKYGAEIQLEANPGNPQKADTSITIKAIQNQPDIKGYVTAPGNPGKAHLVNADKVYMYLAKEDMGRIELGSIEGVADELFYYAPASFGTGGVDGLYQDFLGGEVVDTCYKPKNSARSLKATYITPRVEGFQAGISFTPTNARRGRHVKRNKVALTDPGSSKLDDENFENVVEYGVNYINTFDGLGVMLAATAAQGNALRFPHRSYNDLSSYGFGANLVHSGFTLGGSWVNNNRSGYFRGNPQMIRLSKGRERGWSLGLQYETGPVIIGTNYANMRTAGDTTLLGKDRSSVVSGGATYKVASGLSVFTEVTGVHRKFKRAENGNPIRKDRDHRVVGLIGSKVDW